MNPSADKILTSVMQEVSLHKKRKKEKKKGKRKQKQNKTKKNTQSSFLKDQDKKTALISRYKAKP